MADGDGLKLLIDMNLSPRWVGVLQAAGHHAEHWVDVGNPRADDAEVLQMAHDNGYVVLTMDLDFGDLLAASGGRSPSVVQIRGDDGSPEAIGARVLVALRQCSDALEDGALVSIDVRRARIRLLPLKPKA
jgi:predicted nuclease of predicted toxin-antitoxin system